MSIHRGLRIAYCGAGATGKTTSAKFLSKQLDLPLIKSASRTAYEKLNLTEKKVLQLSPKEKLALQTTIFETKIELDQQYEYVADRTILDHYVYCLAYCSPFLSDDEFFYYEEKVRQSMFSTYTHIVYFPWGYWFTEGDGIRQEHKAWQSMIDAILVGYLIRWNLPVITAPQTKGIDYRNQFILKIINKEC